MTSEAKGKGVQIWRAFFSDYRDLKQGILFELGQGPEGYSNMCSDFEVVNKHHLDLANEEIKTLRSQLEVAKEKLKWLATDVNCSVTNRVAKETLAQLEGK
jgi:hypothetical protein